MSTKERHQNMYSRIRSLREEAELNQTQMATVLKMSQTGYSKYETGENDIPTEILIELSEYHKVSVDYILGITNKKQPYPRDYSQLEIDKSYAKLNESHKKKRSR